MSKKPLPELQKSSLKLALPLQDWHVYQGNSNDCGPFCVAIVSNTLRQHREVEAETLARALEAPLKRAALPSRVAGWATFPWGVVRAFKMQGLAARWRVLAAEQQLWDNLERNVATVVIVGEPLYFQGRRWHPWSHYKVLYGWDAAQGWVFVDPASNRKDGLSWHEPAAFRREWSWMGRQLIEVQTPGKNRGND